MRQKYRLVLLLVLLIGGLYYLIKPKKEHLAAKPWMLKQIHDDLDYVRQNGPISRKTLDLLTTDKKYEYLGLVKYTIKDNCVSLKQNFPGYNERVGKIKAAIKRLCSHYTLPDMEFIFTAHDELGEELNVPVFVMAKNKHKRTHILMPDFEALEGKYQVLQTGDITKEVLSWEKKKNQLIWRGSTAQHSLSGSEPMRSDNLHNFSRVRLCTYTQQYPQMIDAGFTIYVQGAEEIPDLKQFQGSFISFEDQFHYKYHMLIDGNSCSYSASGWKFFSNSLVFKPDSDSIQWYYNELKPYVHYIPVKEGLEDLIEKIHWAVAHDEKARLIAKRARDFALNNLNKKQNFIYFYHALRAYSQLPLLNNLIAIVDHLFRCIF